MPSACGQKSSKSLPLFVPDQLPAMAYSGYPIEMNDQVNNQQTQPIEIQSAAETRWVIQETRNVVIIGKTGSGKSSLGNHILRLNRFPLSDSTLSSTQPSSNEGLTHGSIQGTVKGVHYTIKVIDTVGLYDTQKLENKKAVDTIKKYVIQNLSDGVHLIMFVFKKGRYTKEEKETFEFINNNFGSEIKVISAMVITHCETDGEESRATLVRDFKTNHLTKDIAEGMGKGIFTVGFPDVDKMPDMLKAVFKPIIEKDESTINDLIIQSQETVIIRESFWDKCQIL